MEEEFILNLSSKGHTNISLYGFSLCDLRSFLIKYYTNFDNYYIPLSLTPKGMNLLANCVDHEVYITYSPLEFIKRNLPCMRPRNFFRDSIHTIDKEILHYGVNLLIQVLNENGFIYTGNQDWDENKCPEFYDKSHWVYALNLEEKLFIPSKIDQLFKFYKKSPTHLALQYRKNPKLLPKDQIDRLIHESDHEILKILEDDKYSNLRPDDSVISQISQKFTFHIKKGKIFL